MAYSINSPNNIPSQSPSMHDRNNDASSDQWSNPSTNRMRTGSVSSGMNTMTGPASRGVSSPQGRYFGDSSSPMRNMSTSVFDLHQSSGRQPYVPGWSPGPLQPSQSVSQLNCMSCHQQQQPQWGQPMGWDGQQMNQMNNNGSNMSLNVMPHAYYQQQMHDGMHQHPPPTWMNGWTPQQSYPYPIGMMPMLPHCNISFIFSVRLRLFLRQSFKFSF